VATYVPDPLPLSARGFVIVLFTSANLIIND